MVIDVHPESHGPLLLPAQAINPARSRPGLAQRGQKQSHEQGEDGEDHENFHQREPARAAPHLEGAVVFQRRMVEARVVHGSSCRRKNLGPIGLVGWEIVSTESMAE